MGRVIHVRAENVAQAPLLSEPAIGETEEQSAVREAYTARLAAYLQDPEFRAQPGFPVGSDEAILAMSDPPYYTACLNPFISEWIEQVGKPYDPNEPYHREPFAVDVSEGKTDPLYRAHGYHTKVPHLAIVPSILHYTEPGDIVLDGFCGSGMTGVATQWCGLAPGSYRQKLEAEWHAEGREAPEWGARRAILNDLSPAATFIAANYVLPFDVARFAAVAKQLLAEVDNDLVGCMRQTTPMAGSDASSTRFGARYLLVRNVALRSTLLKKRSTLKPSAFEKRLPARAAMRS